MAIIPTAVLASQTAKIARQQSVQYLGFDFIPLITSLFVFYTVAFLIAKFMEASQYATGGFIALANLLGFNIPTAQELPNNWNKLFTDEGINGIKFWDIINIVAVLAIIVTALNFQKSTEASGNKVQITTWLVFGLIATFFTIGGLSKLVVKMQQYNFQNGGR